MSLHLDRAQYKPEIAVTQIRFQEEADVSGFLLHLATKEGVAASTQNQALKALLFL